MSVGTVVGLLGLFLCLLGHRFFDFGECLFAYAVMVTVLFMYRDDYFTNRHLLICLLYCYHSFL